MDAIALRHRLRDALAEHFADPTKLKVFHGADMDVQWLQRDFGIYVVGMFDTGQAARVLDLPSKGLAYLLSHYCGVSADKRFQLADWRLRPLTNDMLEYARGDTHHLLYVHDRLKQQLEASSGANSNPPGRHLIRETLDRSRDVCRKLYAPNATTPTSYREDYEKNASEAKTLTTTQLAAYAAVFAWRDKKARELDESLGYRRAARRARNRARVSRDDASASRRRARKRAARRQTRGGDCRRRTTRRRCGRTARHGSRGGGWGETEREREDDRCRTRRRLARTRRPRG